MTTKLTALLAEMEEKLKKYKIYQDYSGHDLVVLGFYLGKESEAQFIIEKLKQLLKEEK